MIIYADNIHAQFQHMLVIISLTELHLHNVFTKSRPYTESWYIICM